jgi:hypothetical protein
MNTTLVFQSTRPARATQFIAILGVLASACATPSTVAPGQPTSAQADSTVAPSFEELFDTYFDKGTAGHCATAGCHADPGHNVWLCTTKDACYQGMLDVGLIDATDPTHSQIADFKRSPLTWVNPAGGSMPLDAQGDNEVARDAIKAWVAAGAAND